ncbi:MAG: DUF962 domain-containing protein [Acidobacteria bacterium]|jgi:hypothetical protein|nr:DUF962 domain-containing protein [Acidobacteriota bacterium]
MERRLSSFEEFWPYYVAQHAHPANRALHFVGTSLVLAIVAAVVTLGTPLWLVLVPLAGYGPVWIGHLFVEKNRPASLKYPLWSLRGDFRMYRLMWMAQMEPELARARSLYAAEA